MLYKIIIEEGQRWFLNHFARVAREQMKVVQKKSNISNIPTLGIKTSTEDYFVSLDEEI
ncbi:hypothetical protein GLW08_14985 [Pontibacillus yanchengensis]|uniref:Uncharacterized protein n=1 Tax=Pontibacillus yanchengensis TaxID=462910 RepID=A0ACC7VI41_9BACI|nr:hypothetical protein [Pontibacillus yanchengensis]MYL54638.1 hypothetical protein [Pontibacillus yanchengensis]